MTQVRPPAFTWPCIVLFYLGTLEGGFLRNIVDALQAAIDVESLFKVSLEVVFLSYQ